MAHVPLKISEGAKFSRIYALGAARGSLSVTNDDIAGPIDSSDEWIRQRTGVITRKRATKDVTAADLATEAAKEAIAKAGIKPEQIDIVLISTISNTVQTPSMAALVADRVGATPAAAYDISAACAGYTYGIAQADSFVRSGLAKFVLVIGAEKLSEIVEPTDRSISFLLGDGAGATIVGPSDFPGISPTVWGSDGSKWDTIGMTNTLIEYRDGQGTIAWPTLHQEGQTVFRWAVWEMAKVAQKALDEAIHLAAALKSELCIGTALEEAALTQHGMGLGSYIDVDRVKQDMRATGNALLDRASATAVAAGCTPQRILIESDTKRLANMIVDAANQWNADLLVMGTHGRRGFERLLVGSVAEHVIRIATTSLMLVREA